MSVLCRCASESAPGFVEWFDKGSFDEGPLNDGSWNGLLPLNMFSTTWLPGSVLLSSVSLMLWAPPVGKATMSPVAKCIGSLALLMLSQQLPSTTT